MRHVLWVHRVNIIMFIYIYKNILCILLPTVYYILLPTQMSSAANKFVVSWIEELLLAPRYSAALSTLYEYYNMYCELRILRHVSWVTNITTCIVSSPRIHVLCIYIHILCIYIHISCIYPRKCRQPQINVQFLGSIFRIPRLIPSPPWLSCPD